MIAIEMLERCINEYREFSVETIDYTVFFIDRKKTAKKMWMLRGAYPLDGLIAGVMDGGLSWENWLTLVGCAFLIVISWITLK
jgi:hypothetical protein